MYTLKRASGMSPVKHIYLAEEDEIQCFAFIGDRNKKTQSTAILACLVGQLIFKGLRKFSWETSGDQKYLPR